MTAVPHIKFYSVLIRYVDNSGNNPYNLMLNNYYTIEEAEKYCIDHTNCFTANEALMIYENVLQPDNEERSFGRFIKEYLGTFMS